MNFRTSPVNSDEELWRLARGGNREAFGRIIERYQSLVCSLAYSSCGNLAVSEDLAQETFVSAWQRLGDLREPEKLRAWLCGIVRNLAANARRRTLRRGGDPESLEFVAEEPSPSNDPAAETVRREEEALIWRAVGEIPESYREPLILFYREQQSVAEVAAQLDLSDETVRQRLSRGRAMLREEMTVLVESTLQRTRPAAVFTAGVLAALPFAATSSASAATVAEGIVQKSAMGAAKSALGRAGFGAVIGAAIGLLIGTSASRLLQSTARSEQERRCLARHARWAMTWCFAMSALLALGLSGAGHRYQATPLLLLIGITAWVGLLIAVLLGIDSHLKRNVRRIRAETGTVNPVSVEPEWMSDPKRMGPGRLESKLRLLGLPLYSLAWGGCVVKTYRKQTARGWIAIGDYAFSPLLAVGGIAVAPLAFGGTTIGFVSIGGVAFGALSGGLVAAGWWSFGCIALGWLAAAGAVAVARDYALGFIAQAAQTNTVEAQEWFRSQWFTQCAGFISEHALWFLFCGIVFFVAAVFRRLARSYRAGEKIN